MFLYHCYRCCRKLKISLTLTTTFKLQYFIGLSPFKALLNKHIYYYIACLKDNVVSFSDQIGSVAQSCPTLCDPMNRSTLGLPVHHHLPEFTETHVYQVSDAIQPFHPLSSPSPPAPNPSQHQSLLQ